MFSLYNRHYCFIVHDHSKFPAVKKTDAFSTDSLFEACKKKIMSDVGSNFISEKFKEFYKNLNIEQAALLSYHHQCIGQVEACIRFTNWMLKKWFDTNADVNLALLQVRSTSLGPELSSPLNLLFSFPIKDMMPLMNRSPLNEDSDTDHYETFPWGQQ